MMADVSTAFSSNLNPPKRNASKTARASVPEPNKSPRSKCLSQLEVNQRPRARNGTPSRCLPHNHPTTRAAIRVKKPLQAKSQGDWGSIGIASRLSRAKPIVPNVSARNMKARKKNAKRQPLRGLSCESRKIHLMSIGWCRVYMLEFRVSSFEFLVSPLFDTFNAETE